jgi:hypothetical protein
VKHKSPPVYTPRMMPPDIAKKHSFTKDDHDVIAKHLSTYQRRGIDRSWREYSKKIEVALLEKWGKVLFDCRANGFINPVSINDKIVWAQLIGKSFKSDQCTLCPNKIDDGSCPGLTDENDRFKPCWKE